MPFPSAESLPLPNRTEGFGPLGESRGEHLRQRKQGGHIWRWDLERHLRRAREESTVVRVYEAVDLGGSGHSSL